MTAAKRKPRPFVWVVEIKEGCLWLPCSDCSIDHDDCNARVNRWATENPDDKFRIQKYVREEK